MVQFGPEGFQPAPALTLQSSPTISTPLTISTPPTVAAHRQRGRAIVIDRYPSAESGHVVQMLRANGLATTAVRAPGQLPNACGYHAAQWACNLHELGKAFDMFDLEKSQAAISPAKIAAANAHLGKPRLDAELLLAEEVMSLITWQQGHTNLNWLSGVMSLNHFHEHVMDSLREASGQVNIAVVNTAELRPGQVGPGQAGGRHWFLVGFVVEAKEMGVPLPDRAHSPLEINLVKYEKQSIGAPFSSPSPSSSPSLSSSKLPPSSPPPQPSSRAALHLAPRSLQPPSMPPPMQTPLQTPPSAATRAEPHSPTMRTTGVLLFNRLWIGAFDRPLDERELAVAGRSPLVALIGRFYSILSELAESRDEDCMHPSATRLTADAIGQYNPGASPLLESLLPSKPHPLRDVFTAVMVFGFSLNIVPLPTPSSTAHSRP